MSETMRLTIVTPEGRACSKDVEMVTLPGTDGDMTVYPVHTPVVARLRAGEVLTQAAGQTDAFAVGEGFVQVVGDQVSIFTDMAVDAERIDEAAAEEALKRAEARLNATLTDEEIATVNATLLHSVTQLHVKRHRKA